MDLPPPRAKSISKYSRYNTDTVPYDQRFAYEIATVTRQSIKK